MSLLYRFTKLQDRADTHVFTFVVTRSVTRDLERDVTSKEFTAGHHRWAITFSRNDKVLGVYLVWRSASEGIRVSADFAFTLLNREHFSANEAFSGRQVKFTAGCPAQGNRNYIPVNDLYGRNFTDSHGEFQLELSIGNVRTLFDTHIRTQQTLFFGLGVGGGGGGGNKSDSEAHQHTNHHHHKHQRHHKHQQQSPVPEGGGGGRQGSSRHSSPRRSAAAVLNSSASDGVVSGEESTAGRGGKKQSLTKYETAHFTFGGFDWNVCVYPTGDGSPASVEEGRGTSGRRRGGSSTGRMSVYLNRLTGFDHQCRLRYSLSLGEGDRRLDSGPVEDHSDAEGRGLGWHPRARLSDLVSRRGGGGGGALLRVRLEMIEARTLSEVAIAAAGLSGGLLSPGMPTSIGNTLRPVSPSASSYSIAAAASPLSSCAPGGVLGGAASPSSPSAQHHGPLSNANSPPGGGPGPCSSQCYDRDKQAWIIRTDTHSETVRLHMVFKDVQNVPRNHLRYVCWTAFLLRYHHKSGLVEPVALPGGPFSHYYAQDVSDEGIIMETDIPVKEMREPDCPYLTEKGQVRVRVEWGECHLLFQATYHKYDDVSRIHNHQMRREISALQAENYSLERQLFSYQKSIAYAHSRGSSYPDELTSPSQDLGEYARRGDDDDDDEYYDEDGGGGGRAYSLGDRSLSTDTEYA
ncbi:uncharacterized protein LOC124165208 [Ischnura elegans]|uniref:uncharacterized protein LOC124165208 n=1 Tax=Ischnura elegans TaxID=197161 RepID=UPI001ED87D62|nr:uncharacterized protein LOC124165208 [Ischnura elegans]